MLFKDWSAHLQAGVFCSFKVSQPSVRCGYLELRHVLLGQDIEGLLSSCQGRQCLVQPSLALRSDGICLISLSGDSLRLSIHLQMAWIEA